jgi:hypothetical protein
MPIHERDNGKAVSAGPNLSAFIADRGLTAANPLHRLTSATVPTSRDLSRNANREGGLGIGRVHNLQQMAQTVVADPVPSGPQPCAPRRPSASPNLTWTLPVQGWGRLHLDIAEPHAGKEWTDTGANRDRRQLKQRERGEVRTVPCPPDLTALLWQHIRLFGYGDGGRLFRGERNGDELPKLTITRSWKRARQATFTTELAASPLAATPYDLRHAAVSTWLAGGVPPTHVAEWAGQSVEILFRIYAKCLDRGQAELHRRIEVALGRRPSSRPTLPRLDSRP